MSEGFSNPQFPIPNPKSKIQNPKSNLTETWDLSLLHNPIANPIDSLAEGMSRIAHRENGTTGEIHHFLGKWQNGGDGDIFNPLRV
jgi:hypothetical protein